MLVLSDVGSGVGGWWMVVVKDEEVEDEERKVCCGREGLLNSLSVGSTATTGGRD